MKHNIICICLILIAATSCRLSNKSIAGDWRLNDSDTLSFYRNGKFELKESVSKAAGKYTITGRNIYLSFETPGKTLRGGCTHLFKFRTTRRNHLIKPLSCEHPSKIQYIIKYK